MFGRLRRNLGESYSPLYFLAALGAGGLAVSFFMFLMFWVAHPNHPVPVFEDVLGGFTQGGMAAKGAILVAVLGIALFAILHLRLLAWNISEYRRYRTTEAYRTLRAGNGETQLSAIPLTLAMTVNVCFIVGAVFVPGLWSAVEYLLPGALIAFLAIGVQAHRILFGFFARIFTAGGFDCAKNNNLTQMMPTFALAMIGVGLAAPAAFSHVPAVAGIGFLTSTYFITAAVILGAIKLILGFRGMMDQGTDKDTLPTLWVVVPILTVLTIAFMRQDHALGTFFGGHGSPGETLAFLARMLAAQVFFGGLGLVVMRRAGYFETYVIGAEKSPGSYALVCPGVALAVMGHFFINKGLVGAGLIDKFGVAYWLLTAVPLALQVLTIWVMLKLNSKHVSA